MAQLFGHLLGASPDCLAGAAVDKLLKIPQPSEGAQFQDFIKILRMVSVAQSYTSALSDLGLKQLFNWTFEFVTGRILQNLGICPFVWAECVRTIGHIHQESAARGKSCLSNNRILRIIAMIPEPDPITR